MTCVLAYYAFQLRKVTVLLANFITTLSLTTCISLFAFYSRLLYFINKLTTKSLFKTKDDEVELMKPIE